MRHAPEIKNQGNRKKRKRKYTTGGKGENKGRENRKKKKKWKGKARKRRKTSRKNQLTNWLDYRRIFSCSGFSTVSLVSCQLKPVVTKVDEDPRIQLHIALVPKKNVCAGVFLGQNENKKQSMEMHSVAHGVLFTVQ